MKKTERLFFWARMLDIKVVFKGLPNGLLGKANPSSKTITLDSSLKLNNRQVRCVLAEEIGHCLFPPRPGHIRYHSKGFWQTENTGLIKAIVAQDETKALDWATSVLIPDVEFNRIVANGDYTISELIEHFDVEQWFLEHKISYFRRKEFDAGRKVWWRDLIRRI